MGKPAVEIPSADNWGLNWGYSIEDALTEMLRDQVIVSTISEAHIQRTPERFVKALKEMFSGCLIDPKEVIATVFPAEGYSQMIHIKDIAFYSTCAHHLLPFAGSAYFAYIPNDKIVGLSKIPRLVHAYSKRPQVQEKLTEEIVNTFMEVVQPKGCGIVMRAFHFCMICRGVEEPRAYTETTALRGNFLTSQLTKQEFVSSVQSQAKVWI